jgi:FAD/FMN-containing dehydrogenase
VVIFERLLGTPNVLTADLDVYNTDWLDIFKGASRCVLRPQSIDELSSVLQHCHARRLAVCTQSGNTGLVGGSVPVFDEIVVKMSRMTGEFEFDAQSGVLRCSAGHVLQALDERIGEHGFMMPLDLVDLEHAGIGGQHGSESHRVLRVRVKSAVTWQRVRVAYVSYATAVCTHTHSA